MKPGNFSENVRIEGTHITPRIHLAKSSHCLAIKGVQSNRFHDKKGRGNCISFERSPRPVFPTPNARSSSRMFLTSKHQIRESIAARVGIGQLNFPRVCSSRNVQHCSLSYVVDLYAFCRKRSQITTTHSTWKCAHSSCCRATPGACVYRRSLRCGQDVGPMVPE